MCTRLISSGKKVWSTFGTWRWQKAHETGARAWFHRKIAKLEWADDVWKMMSAQGARDCCESSVSHKNHMRRYRVRGILRGWPKVQFSRARFHIYISIKRNADFGTLRKVWSAHDSIYFVLSFITKVLHSVLLDFIPSFIPSFIYAFVPSFIPSFLPSFLQSVIMHWFIHCVSR